MTDLRTEAASMTDEEVLEQFERCNWDKTGEIKQILAEDIAQRFEREVILRGTDDGW